MRTETPIISINYSHAKNCTSSPPSLNFSQRTALAILSQPSFLWNGESDASFRSSHVKTSTLGHGRGARLPLQAGRAFVSYYTYIHTEATKDIGHRHHHQQKPFQSTITFTLRATPARRLVPLVLLLRPCSSVVLVVYLSSYDISYLRRRHIDTARQKR